MSDFCFFCFFWSFCDCRIPVCFVSLSSTSIKIIAHTHTHERRNQLWDSTISRIHHLVTQSIVVQTNRPQMDIWSLFIVEECVRKKLECSHSNARESWCRTLGSYLNIRMRDSTKARECPNHRITTLFTRHKISCITLVFEKTSCSARCIMVCVDLSVRLCVGVCTEMLSLSYFCEMKTHAPCKGDPSCAFVRTKRKNERQHSAPEKSNGVVSCSSLSFVATASGAQSLTRSCTMAAVFPRVERKSVYLI